MHSFKLANLLLLPVLLLCAVAPQAAAQARPAAGLPAGALLAPAAPVEHPILSEVKVRRGISHCTNKAALVQAAYPALTPAEAQARVVHTFVPPNSTFYTQPDHIHEFDPVYGMGLFAQVGWTHESSSIYRSKNGKELALTLTVVDDAITQRYLPVFVEQMRACGVHIILNHQPGSWFFSYAKTGQQVRDFEMYVDGWGTSVENPQGKSYFACDKIPLPTNNWSGKNYMGWCNTTASDAIELASNQNLPPEDRKLQYAIVTDALIMDAPALPLFTRNGSDPVFEVIEHIDFNLDTFMQTIEVDPASSATLNFTDFSGSTGSAYVPSGAEGDTVTLAYTPLVQNAFPPPDRHKAVRAFRLGVYQRGLYQQGFQFQEPITLTVRYSDSDPGPGYDESTLALYYWTGTVWKDARTTCPVENQQSTLDPTINRLRVNICHLTEFSLIAGPYRVYLPSIGK